MASNQRRYQRKALQVDFRGHDAHGAGVLHFTSADLSAGGTFLTSELLLEEGEVLTLQLELPPATRALTLQARVAWVRRFPSAGKAAGMGVEFVALGEDERGALVRYLEG